MANFEWSPDGKWKIRGQRSEVRGPAAGPLDVRKGFAFPKGVLIFFGLCQLGA